jgi:HEPN domain-containing protein
MGIDPMFQILLDACSVMVTYATTTRYPDDDTEITEDNARSAIKEAERIYSFCMAHSLEITPRLKTD